MEMRHLKYCISILLAVFALNSCDWESKPLQLVYPGTDLSGKQNNDNSEKNRILNDFENILDYLRDRGWKFTKKDTDIFYIFNISDGTFQTKSNLDPTLRIGEYKVSVNDSLEIEFSIEDKDLATIISSTDFIVKEAKITGITMRIAGTQNDIVMLPAKKGEFNDVMTLDEKVLKEVTDVLYDVDKGAGWSFQANGDKVYIVLDETTESYTVKFLSDRSTMKGTYSLTSENGIVRIVMPGSGIEGKIGTDVLVLSVSENGELTAGAGDTIYTLSHASKEEIDGIKSDLEILLHKMVENEWGSRLVRKSNGTFAGHFYVDLDNIAINFTTYENGIVTHSSPAISASGDKILLSSPVTFGSSSITSFTVGNVISIDGLGSDLKTTRNLSWGKDGVQHDMIEYITTAYTPGTGIQYQFKNHPVTVSESLRPEYETTYKSSTDVRIYEWNGDYGSFVVFIDNYYFLQYQGGDMTPIDGTDVIRFNRNAGLMDLGWTSTSLDKYKNIMGKTWSFFFDEDHIIVRYGEDQYTGLLILSTTGSDFIYWPKAVD